MSRAPNLLLMTNEASPGDASGQIDGYRILQSTGELGRVDSVSVRAGFDADPQQAVARVLEAVSQTKPDIALIWTPGRFPGSRSNFERIMAELGSARVVYWEGDAWGGKKAVTEQMTWWLSVSDAVFSVCGDPQARQFLQLGAREVFHTLHTYDHLAFVDSESASPRTPCFDAVMIASNAARVPGISGLPGSVGRWRLARGMRRELGEKFLLYGGGWPTRWSQGKLSYRDQQPAYRSAKLSVNWDHYPQMSDSSSDRLPIALLAGRPHVTTAHPGMAWAPGEDLGLFQAKTPKEVIDVAAELLAGDPADLALRGERAHDWVKGRLSHREAARRVMSVVVGGVGAPPQDPWGALPGPWASGL